jgi:hypothetical protein
VSSIVPEEKVRVERLGEREIAGAVLAGAVISGAAEADKINPKCDDGAGGDGAGDDGIDRRGFLKCMTWAGTGVLWSFAGGIPTSRLLAQEGMLRKAADFTFV